MESDRYQRLRETGWWDRNVVVGSTALVAGVGALGNEVVKNLALMGVGRIILFDHDIVESSNITRSVLFRQADIGASKVEAAKSAVNALNPECQVFPYCGDILGDLGPGVVRRATAVLGCVDNVAARLHLSIAAGTAGVPYIDGGLGVWEGTVSGFTAGDGSCYGCTLSRDDVRDMLARQSCAAFAARAEAASGLATTVILSSVIGAVTAQEFLKVAHRFDGNRETLLGRQLRVDLAHNRSWNLSLPRNDSCRFHPERAEIATCKGVSREVSWQRIVQAGAALLGAEVVSVHLPFVVAKLMECGQCGDPETDWVVRKSAIDLACPSCGKARLGDVRNQILGGEPWLVRTPRQMGAPNWPLLDFVDASRNVVTIELAGADGSLACFGG